MGLLVKMVSENPNALVTKEVLDEIYNDMVSCIESVERANGVVLAGDRWDLCRIKKEWTRLSVGQAMMAESMWERGIYERYPLR